MANCKTPVNERQQQHENHEIAVCQHGYFSHSSVLFRSTYLLLLSYYISGKNHADVVVVLLRYKQELGYIENIEPQSNLK